MKRLFVSFVFVVLACGAMAYDFSAVAPTGQTLYYTINDSSSVTVVHPSRADVLPWYDFVAPSGSLTIPSTVSNDGHTYTVTDLGRWLFYCCEDLTSVTIPNTITHISSNAFCHCTNLLNVNIPNTVTSIGESAFQDCTSFTSVTIPVSVTDIGNYAFTGCRNVDTLYYYAQHLNTTSSWYTSTYNDFGFRPLTNLRVLIIGSGVETLPDGVFNRQANITVVTIPGSVSSIGESAFLGCSALDSVFIPSSVTSIGKSAFRECASLTSVSILGADSIGDFSFYDCDALTRVVFGGGLAKIGVGAFANCDNLAQVDFGPSLVSIGSQAFYYCGGLSSLSFPSSLADIGDHAFYYCRNVSSITSEAATAPRLGDGSFYGVRSDTPVYIPCGSGASYSDSWSCFDNFVEGMMYSLTAATSDSIRGIVLIEDEPTCFNPIARVRAVPNSGYRFDHWDDGSTDNPRSLVLTCDSAVMAFFVSDVSIDGVLTSSCQISSREGRVVVSNAANAHILVYDQQGHLLTGGNCADAVRVFPVPSSGVYFVRVDNLPAQKVVVVK